MLLIVAHALRHVTPNEEPAQQKQELNNQQPLTITPELLEQLRLFLSKTTVTEEQGTIPQISETATGTNEQGSRNALLFFVIPNPDNKTLRLVY